MVSQKTTGLDMNNLQKSSGPKVHRIVAQMTQSYASKHWTRAQDWYRNEQGTYSYQKLSQIGSVSETIAAPIGTMAAAKMTCVISHRSGETEDTTTSLRCRAGCDRLTIGSLCRTDRVAKYNEPSRESSRTARKESCVGGRTHFRSVVKFQRLSDLSKHHAEMWVCFVYYTVAMTCEYQRNKKKEEKWIYSHDALFIEIIQNGK